MTTCLAGIVLCSGGHTCACVTRCTAAINYCGCTRTTVPAPPSSSEFTPWGCGPAVVCVVPPEAGCISAAVAAVVLGVVIAGSRRLSPNFRETDSSIAVVTGNQPLPQLHRYAMERPVCLPRMHIECHMESDQHQLVCESLNIRSLTNKLDDLLDVRNDNQIDVLLLVQTWLDVTLFVFVVYVSPATRSSIALARGLVMTH
jgi:hypothetical protein